MNPKIRSEDYMKGYRVGYSAGVKERKKHLTNFNKIKVTNDGRYYESDEFVCSACGIHIEDWTCRTEEGDSVEFGFRYCPNCGGKVERKEE